MKPFSVALEVVSWKGIRDKQHIPVYYIEPDGRDYLWLMYLEACERLENREWIKGTGKSKDDPQHCLD